MNSYLKFLEVARKPKTSVVGVFSVSQQCRLGTIAWHGPWRQYVFEPKPNTIWSAGCLRDVEEKLAGLREEMKARKGSQ